MVLQKTPALPLTARSWGPPMWRTIHAVAYSSPPIEAFRAFMHALASVVPCDACRRDLAEVLKTGADNDGDAAVVPIERLTNADDLLEWTVRLHARISPERNQGPRWTRDMAAASLLSTADKDPKADSDQSPSTAENVVRKATMMIGPNALGLGLAVGIMIAAVALGFLAAFAYAVFALMGHLRSRTSFLIGSRDSTGSAYHSWVNHGIIKPV
jgi:hypothetical protein